MSGKYKVGEDAIPHFVTFSVVGWIDVFSLEQYKGGPVHGAITSGQLTSSGVVPNSVISYLSTQPAPGSTKPKAYLNWVLLDEQFNFVQAGSQIIPANETGTAQQIIKIGTDAAVAQKNGYVYIYVSNESNNLVYFDNLQITHIRGPILEETHYYPFGLSMAGISSKALNNSPENKYKYNKGSELQNNEFSDGRGLELYATNFRSLDPQLGRWWQTDPKPDYAQSLYSAMNNNPISFNDPLGDTIRHSFRTGFLGIFGKKANLTYDEKNKRWNNKDGSAYTGKTTKFSNMVLNDLQTNQKNELGNIIVTNLATDKLDHNIKRGDPNGNRTDDPNIYYSGSVSDNQKILEGGKANNSPSYVVLGHEMAHKFMQNLGVKNYEWFQINGEKRGVDEYNAMYYENVLRQANGLPRRVAYTEANGITHGNILDARGNLAPLPANLAPQGISMPAFHALQLFLRLF
ncbi:MAG TPA: RHS repeat-associated core domain-containing protein [Ginsengibacter sp.]|nr:RHS repeat-associated core domain-containing protein [Ginsengibacter sp.]